MNLIVGAYGELLRGCCVYTPAHWDPGTGQSTKRCLLLPSWGGNGRGDTSRPHRLGHSRTAERYRGYVPQPPAFLPFQPSAESLCCVLSRSGVLHRRPGDDSPRDTRTL